MKIYSINACQQQFKGLWGDERYETKSSPDFSWGLECYTGTSHTVTEQDYYPFKDETPEQIEKVRKDYDKYERKTGEYDNAVTYITESILIVKEALPVTAKRYQDYIERKLLSRMEMRVEDKLKRAGLQRFLRK